MSQSLLHVRVCLCPNASQMLDDMCWLVSESLGEDEGVCSFFVMIHECLLSF